METESSNHYSNKYLKPNFRKRNKEKNEQRSLNKTKQINSVNFSSSLFLNKKSKTSKKSLEKKSNEWINSQKKNYKIHKIILSHRKNNTKPSSTRDHDLNSTFEDVRLR